jgi:hypothetical protein
MSESLATGRPPRVWVLLDDRPGSTSQALGLARALGWPFEVKRLAFGPVAALHNRLLGASRRGLRPRAPGGLEPPWPDLVIAAGRRTAPVARWIRDRAGGRARLVQLGRKGGDAADLFDLVVTPSYARLPPHPRRLVVGAPLHGVSRELLAEARERFRTPLGALPAPRLALLVGGTSGQYKLGPRAARRVGREVARFAARIGASLMATTSRRSGRRSARALRASLPPGSFLHLWSADSRENPYLGLLAWADALVVTGDSESMLSEALATGRPVYVFELPTRWSFPVLRALRDAVERRARAAGGDGSPARGLARQCRRAIELGLVRPARDLADLHRDLARRGLASPFGSPGSLGPFDPADRPAEREMERVAARVRALVQGGR